MIGAQRRLIQQPLKQRNNIRRGFAGSRLRLAGHVLAIESKRQRLALDGSALCKAGLRDTPLQLGRQRKVGKSQIG